MPAAAPRPPCADPCRVLNGLAKPWQPAGPSARLAVRPPVPLLDVRHGGGSKLAGPGRIGGRPARRPRFSVAGLRVAAVGGAEQRAAALAAASVLAAVSVAPLTSPTTCCLHSHLEKSKLNQVIP